MFFEHGKDKDQNSTELLGEVGDNVKEQLAVLTQISKEIHKLKNKARGLESIMWDYIDDYYPKLEVLSKSYHFHENPNGTLVVCEGGSSQDMKSHIGDMFRKLMGDGFPEEGGSENDPPVEGGSENEEEQH